MLLWTWSKSCLGWDGDAHAKPFSEAHGFGLPRATVRGVPASAGLSIGTIEWEVNKIDCRLRIKVPTAWAVWAAWMIYQARVLLHFVHVLGRQQPLQDQGVWLGALLFSMYPPSPFPCSVQGWKAKGKKSKVWISLLHQGKMVLKINSFPRRQEYVRILEICTSL